MKIRTTKVGMHEEYDRKEFWNSTQPAIFTQPSAN